MPTLREIICKANPEIMELKFGCEILVKNDVRTRVIGIDGRVVFFSPLVNNRNTDFVEDITILGRTIRLADVLVAVERTIKGNDIYWSVDTSGQIYGTNELDPVQLNNFPEIDHFIKHTPGAKWNLLDDNLDHQTPECKKFLEEILIN